ncbi:LOW QUALITY PROTEIN: protein DEPP1 [Glossophaga mutica]
MRSWLLLSVAHLPTIWESWEEMLPVGPGQEPLASPSLDDYMKSICQLVQPSPELNEAIVRAQPSRHHWPAQACKKSYLTGFLDTTPCFSSQHSLLPRVSTADPLDWLFGQSLEERQTRWRDLSRRTGPSAEPWGSHRQMNSSKVLGRPRGKLCDPRAPGHYLVRLLRAWNQGSQTSRQRLQAAASPPSSSPSSVLRTLLHLLVVHEL